MMHPRSLAALTLLAALLSAAAPACSAKDAAAPSAGTYTISFPSTAAAVAADSVKVFVFDAADGGAQLCPTLVIARRSNQALPTALVEAPAVSPCDLAAGKGAVTISYGTRAVLAVAQKGPSDFLIGCAIQNIGEGSTQVPVQLALAATTVDVPSTTCGTLGDHCAGRCQ
jgi:hypothetical protein